MTSSKLPAISPVVFRAVSSLCGTFGSRKLLCGLTGVFSLLWFKILGNRKGDLSPHLVGFYDRYIVRPSRALTLFGRAFGENVYVVASKD